MSKIKFGAEVYAWFMKESGQAHKNQLDHMIELSAKAGFRGIEPIHHWMGDLSDPARLADCLKANNVELAAIALALDWNGTHETEDEKRQADETIALLKQFPGAMLCSVQMPTGRHDLVQRRLNLVDNVNTVSARATEAGVPCSFHPNSPQSSTNRTSEDYEVILNGLNPEVTGWTPDVGHIANGGMDPLGKMIEFESLINLVHYKDWDGNPEWAMMGEGKVDFVGITKWLADRDYDGWIICEDECERAVESPDEVTLHDGEYCAKNLFPIIS